MTANTIYPLTADRPNETDLLKFWLAARAATDQDVIRDSETYRHIWSTWCKYLKSGRGVEGSQPIPWFEADAETVVGFLKSGPVNRREKLESSSNETTKRRYWRVLDRIYNFAMSQNWLDINPVTKMAAVDKPKSEDTLGTVLDSLVWNAAEKLLSQPDRFDPISVRNRAILHVLFGLGLAPQEVRALKMNSLLYDGTVGEERRLSKLSVDGHNTLRPRTLTLSPKVSSAILEWLKARPGVATTSSGMALFCTPKGPLGSVSLYLLVQSFLKKASELAQREEPPQTGPQVIRNSLLVRMLEDGEHSSPWVARFAGLKNVKGLWHLRIHCSDEVRATLTNIRDDADCSEAVV